MGGFKTYMAEYEADTHQLFHLRSSISANHRNKEVKTADETLLIPKEFTTFWTNTGQRKSYFGKPTKSKAEVKAAVTWNDDENKFMVRVTGCSIHHNNQVAQTVYDNHSSVRRVEDPVLLEYSSGSKPKKIMQFLQEKTGDTCTHVIFLIVSLGKNVALRDVHNMVANTTVEQQLECLLRGFCQCRGNRSSFFVDDDELAQVITLQTRQVRRWFKAFPEGQYVQNNLMEKERTECLSDVINALKFCNMS
ncbi:ABC transporter [Phytophthora megakarya]|uniref:ABC transporter n=1 Tax=Phytophthora megakarya TaxID=4795 RepID=A0A225VL87_9STRA|nr:ABC transporter [Phytophthora megakarya]